MSRGTALTSRRPWRSSGALPHTCTCRSAPQRRSTTPPGTSSACLNAVLDLGARCALESRAWWSRGRGASMRAAAHACMPSLALQPGPAGAGDSGPPQLRDQIPPRVERAAAQPPGGHAGGHVRARARPDGNGSVGRSYICRAALLASLLLAPNFRAAFVLETPCGCLWCRRAVSGLCVQIASEPRRCTLPIAHAPLVVC